MLIAWDPKSQSAIRKLVSQIHTHMWKTCNLSYIIMCFIVIEETADRTLLEYTHDAFMLSVLLLPNICISINNDLELQKR